MIGNDHHDPSNAAGNGDARGPNGRFLPGNTAGRGNPMNRKAQQLRNAMLAAITEQDVIEVLDVMRGIWRDPATRPADRLATCSEFNRLLEKLAASDVPARLEWLEHAMAEGNNGRLHIQTKGAANE